MLGDRLNQQANYLQQLDQKRDENLTPGRLQASNSRTGSVPLAGGGELKRYQSRTVFPPVFPQIWGVSGQNLP